MPCVCSHLGEDTVPILCLHHIQDVGRDISGLATAIPKLPPLLAVLQHLADKCHRPTQVRSKLWPCFRSRLLFFFCLFFYLEDFILEHRQLIGIPGYKVVEDFGIFPWAVHSIIRPVGTGGIVFICSCIQNDRKVWRELVYLPI